MNIDRAVATIRALRVAAQKTVDLEELSDDDISTIAALYDDWTTKDYGEGDIVNHDGILFECIQQHTAIAGWEPEQTPSLWKRVRDTTGAEPDAWVQPAGQHDAYNTGDKVTHNGSIWTSTTDNNVWEPGAFGWVQD